MGRNDAVSIDTRRIVQRCERSLESHARIHVLLRQLGHDTRRCCDFTESSDRSADEAESFGAHAVGYLYSAMSACGDRMPGSGRVEVDCTEYRQAAKNNDPRHPAHR